MVTRLPSSRPAAASTNAPVQWLMIMAPRAWASRNASRSAGDGTRSKSSHAVIETMSEAASRSSPCSTVIGMPVSVRSTPGASLTRAKSKRGSPMCAPVVAEHLGADSEPEAAHETVGHDDADDQGTVLLCHADTMAEKLR